MPEQMVKCSIVCHCRNFSNSFIGMFLFAKLVMNNLAKQPNLALFRNEIASARLPNEIDQAYVCLIITQQTHEILTKS